MFELKDYILEDVVEKFIDYRGKTPTKVSTGVPLITAKIVKGGKILEPNEFISFEDYHLWMTRGYPEVNDLVLTTEAPLGEVALLKNKEVALAQRIITIRPKKEICNSVYLKYFFQNDEGQQLLHSRATGTTVEGIKSAELKKIQITLPSLNIQQSIAEVLSSLDDKIDLLHRQNKSLEQMAEALFRQWFVEGKEEITEEVQLTHYANHIKKSINPANTPELIFNHYSLPAYDNGQKPEQQSGKEILSNKYKIEAGQILISKLNPRTPRVWYIHECNQSSVCSTEFQVFQPKNKEFTEFVYCWLKSRDTKDILSGAASGTSGSHQRVSPDDICALTIFRPDETKIMEFHLMCKDWLTKIAVNNQQIGVLEKLRDLLLPKLMNGSVRVTEN